MIWFVNAKINIGLRVTGKRPDGYHNLETLFYPVGIYAGTAENTERFGDILEITPEAEPGFRFETRGRVVDCPVDKNLVYKAAKLYFDEMASPGFGARIVLEKHLPDGAGLGGGSADAAFTLKGLSALDALADDATLARQALRLGADCPFFIYNRPMYAEGIGELLEPEPGVDLSGCWITIIKPRIYISTKEAFAGIHCRPSETDLRELAGRPLEDYRFVAVNDFEASVFPAHPELPAIKRRLYDMGAKYASMSGSGSSIYGIFTDRELAATARHEFMNDGTIEASYLLKM